MHMQIPCQAYAFVPLNNMEVLPTMHVKPGSFTHRDRQRRVCVNIHFLYSGNFSYSAFVRKTETRGAIETKSTKKI